jgi:hypothetical protein
MNATPGGEHNLRVFAAVFKVAAKWTREEGLTAPQAMELVAKLFRIAAGDVELPFSLLTFIRDGRAWPGGPEEIAAELERTAGE